jgi:predicted enzyme related to lactoylglutathione lyase
MNTNTFCWTELVTTTPEVSKGFYSQLFGWTVKEVAMGGGVSYTMLQKDGADVGGLRGLQPNEAGARSHTASSVAVADVDGCAKRAVQLGGTVLIAPVTMPNGARYAVVADPTGLAIGLYATK